MMIQAIKEFISKAEQSGAKKGEHFNAIVIPVSLCDQFEAETDQLLSVKDESIKEHKLFDLDILVGAEGDKIRLAKVY